MLLPPRVSVMLRGAHLRHDHRDQRRAAQERMDIVHGGAHRLIGEVLLPDGNVLLLDAHFLQSADGDERLLHPILHALHQADIATRLERRG